MLETARLCLRPWEDEDAESLYKYAKNPQVGPAAGWPMHTSVEESQKIIRSVFAAPETYAVVLKETDEPIGSIGLMFRDQSHLKLEEDEAELGYWVGVPYWGHGLIPEATREIVRHGFEELGLHMIWCSYFVENEKSKRVAEKCGFRYQYTLENVVVAEDDVRMEYVTCMTREQWGAMNQFDQILKETRESFEQSFAQGSFYERQTKDDDHLKLLLDLADRENAGNILDLGTGTGYLAFPMAERWRGCQIYGLDIVAETLERNKEKASGLKNCHFCAYDGVYFPFENGYFDRVVSRYALHHFPEIEKTLQEIGRVLRAGGLFVLSDPTPNAEDTARFVDRFMRMKPDGHIRFYTEKEWVELAGDAGLRLIKSVDTSITFPRKQAGSYAKLLKDTPKPVLDSYGIAVRGDEIFITEKVLNLVFEKAADMA